MAIYDNGIAPVSQTVNADKANVPKSYFDLSRVRQFNGIIGAVMPFDVIETIPGDSFDLNYLCLVTSRNPLVRELRNGMTVCIHAYWSPKYELWKGWKNFATKGRSGTINLNHPKLLPDFKYDGNTYTTLVPCSPADYMGVPIKKYNKNITNKNYVFKPIKVTEGAWINSNYVSGDTTHNNKWGINALPFVMYNKIIRDYYMNQNLMQGNEGWYPVDDTNACLPYNCDYTFTNDDFGESLVEAYVNRSFSSLPVMQTEHDFEDEQYIGDEDVTKCQPWLNFLHFRQWRGDYFTTGNPFADLLRGDSAEITKAIGSIVNWDFNNATQKLFTSEEDASVPLDRVNTGTGLNGLIKGYWYEERVTELNTKANAVFEASASTVSANLLNNLRKAVVIEKLMQRNGCTDGTYREIVGANLGHKPNTFDGKPRYIGGGTFNINFNSITMTSSDTETQETGDKVSDGLGTGSVNLGKYFCDDYGYIMVCMSIIPDVYYNANGLEHMWTDTKQDQVYIPLTNNLEPQPILNKELFVLNKTNDEGLFAYGERNAHWKSRQNKVSGLGACGSEAVYDSSTLMHRVFTTTPAFNNKFVTIYPNNTDLTPFSSVNEIPFDVMVGCKVGAMRPIPYASKPADMGINF